MVVIDANFRVKIKEILLVVGTYIIIFNKMNSILVDLIVVNVFRI